MSHNDLFDSPISTIRERPFLFPWNRRVRHLQGISVRNLNVTPTTYRSRRLTRTDDEIPNSLRTPTKLLAQDEIKTISHSRSFTDLRTPTKSPKYVTRTSSSVQKDAGTSPRPGGPLRRRSTLHWSGASPEVKQKKLEEVAADRMADVWFSIHTSGGHEPTYISEVIEKSMNPTFRFFDLVSAGSVATRNEELTIKLWVKTEKAEHYKILVEMDLNLRSLQYVGKNLDAFHHPLPQNCILFHLSDGVYTSFTNMPVTEYGVLSETRGISKQGRAEPSSTFDALMRLANLDECIQDALAARQKIERQINQILEKQRSESTRAQKSEAEESMARVDRALIAERKSLRQAQKRRDDCRNGIYRRRKAVRDGNESQRTAQPLIENVEKSIRELENSNSLRTLDQNGQIRRITEDLLLIFPVEPLRNKALHFTIRSIFVPNSAFDDTNRDEIAAALGYTAQIVQMLSLYLSMPIPYPIRVNASESFIRDPISVNLPQRTFPLFPTNVAYKFEYGVFLLNKDIEFLMNKIGLRHLDIRHTLPNLKYLTYVLTAGTGEIPARKAGGVRGLAAGRLTPSISRRGSDESVVTDTNTAILARKAIEPKPSVNRETEFSLEPPIFKQLKGKGLEHRKSSLREVF